MEPHGCRALRGAHAKRARATRGQPSPAACCAPTCAGALTVGAGIRQALRPAQWREALAAAAEALKSVKGSELRFIAGRLADLESMAALKVRARARQLQRAAGRPTAALRAATAARALSGPSAPAAGPRRRCTGARACAVHGKARAAALRGPAAQREVTRLRARAPQPYATLPCTAR